MRVLPLGAAVAVATVASVFVCCFLCITIVSRAAISYNHYKCFPNRLHLFLILFWMIFVPRAFATAAHSPFASRPDTWCESGWMWYARLSVRAFDFFYAKSIKTFFFSSIFVFVWILVFVAPPVSSSATCRHIHILAHSAEVYRNRWKKKCGRPAGR